MQYLLKISFQCHTFSKQFIKSERVSNKFGTSSNQIQLLIAAPFIMFFVLNPVAFWVSVALKKELSTAFQTDLLILNIS